MDYGNDTAGNLRAEVEQLRRWKAEQLQVEADWDIQEVGKALGLVLGTRIRRAILPGIVALKKQLTLFEVRLQQAYVRNNKLIRSIGRWQAKYHTLRLENNALRRKLYARTGAAAAPDAEALRARQEADLIAARVAGQNALGRPLTDEELDRANRRK